MNYFDIFQANLIILGNILRILLTQMQSHPNEPGNFRSVFFYIMLTEKKKKKSCDQCFLECTWLSVSKGLNLIWFIFNLRLFLRINCLQKSFECKSLNSFDSWILQHTQYINLLWGQFLLILIWCLLFFFPVKQICEIC